VFYADIQDVQCVDTEVYLFLRSMEVEVVSVLPASEVVPLYMGVANPGAAAALYLAARTPGPDTVPTALLRDIHHSLLEEGMATQADALGQVLAARVKESEVSETTDSGGNDSVDGGFNTSGSQEQEELHVHASEDLSVHETTATVVAESVQTGDSVNSESNLETDGIEGPSQIIDMQLQDLSISGALGPGQLGPGQLGPGQLGPSQLGPGQLGTGQLGPGQLGPGQLGPGQLADLLETEWGKDMTSWPSVNSHHSDETGFHDDDSFNECKLTQDESVPCVSVSKEEDVLMVEPGEVVESVAELPYKVIPDLPDKVMPELPDKMIPARRSSLTSLSSLSSADVTFEHKVGRYIQKCSLQ